MSNPTYNEKYTTDKLKKVGYLYKQIDKPLRPFWREHTNRLFIVTNKYITSQNNSCLFSQFVNGPSMDPEQMITDKKKRFSYGDVDRCKKKTN